MITIFLNDIISSISDVVNLYSPVTANHSSRVAIIAYNLAKAMPLDSEVIMQKTK